MLNIEKNVEGSKARFALEGRLDTLSSPSLEKELEEVLGTLTELVIDMEKLEYLSSAGLRVLLDAAQVMDEQGEMKVLHVNDAVMDIFSVTGFDEILNIEP